MRIRRKPASPTGGTPTPLTPKVQDAPATGYLSGFLSEKKKPTGGKRATKLRAVEVAMGDAERRAKTGEWDDARPSVLVGLFAICHFKVYGVHAAELEADREFAIATRIVSTFLSNAFDGDVIEGAAFVRWAWRKEQAKIQWAKSKGHTVNRLQLRWVFSMSKVTDYRVEANRGRK